MLRERDFAHLFWARLVSAFGTAMAPVAMAFAILDLTGSATSVGIVLASETGAVLLFQLLGGTLADRGSRKRMMVLADAMATTSQGTIALLLVTGQAEIPVLAGLMAVTGVSFALHGPASVGLVPQVVERQRLQPANALLSLAQSAAFGLGAASAGVLVATVGAGWALAIDAASFAVSAVIVAGVRPRPQLRRESVGLLRDLRDGWREFTSHRWLWTIVLQFSLVVAAWQGSFAVVGPTVAKRMLGGPTDWGWIAGMFGAGLVAGGLLAMRIEVRRPMLVATCCVFAHAVPLLLLAGPSPVWMIAAGAFVAGVGGQIFGVLWFTTLHTRVAPEALSRMSAYDILGSIALAPLGEAAAGPVLESIGTTYTLWIAAAMIIVPTAAVLAVPEVRQLRSQPPSSRLVDER